MNMRPFRAKKIIIATGTSPNYLNIPEKRNLKGREFPIVPPAMPSIMQIRKLSSSEVVIRLLKKLSSLPNSHQK